MDNEADFMSTEYVALREEILKRIEIHYQLISLTLIIAGTLVTAGLQPSVPASVLLIYPILSAFLTGEWVSDGVWILLIGKYIKENHEAQFESSKWEDFIKNNANRATFTGIFSIFSTSGIFLSSQLITIGLALLKFTRTPVEVVLLICDCAAVIITYLLLRNYTNARQKMNS